MSMRRAIFLIHLTTGCLAAFVIFFLAATGFLLAWQKPIVAWQERVYRAAPPPNQTALPLDRLVASAAASAGEQPTSVTLQSDTSAPAEMEFGRTRRLLLNPYSGAVLGAGAIRTRAFFTTVTALHRWFGAAPEYHASAKLVKGTFALALLLMIVTGAILWIPRAWSWPRLKAGSMLRLSLRGRARDWNRHNVIGFWVALPLTVMVLTGAILAYGWMTSLLYLVTGSPLPRAQAAAIAKQHHPHHKVDTADSAAAVTLQQIFDSARRQAVGWHIIRIPLPIRADRPVEVAVDFLDGSRPDQQAAIAFDAKTGAVLRLTTFSSFSLGRQLRSFMKYIHTGEAGGLAGETAAGLTALACCALVWTGLAMALRRLRSMRSTAACATPVETTAAKAIFTAGTLPD